MSYKALLFCPDDRTAKTVTQVLNELEFQVEVCNEPFTAVKKLMAGHFDAVVVDCDNEQNATLLFKSARNSEFNQASLSVAVVEGQSGVAKAFRIGANLVLTKPINVEQSKGTLRVARGLLRKNEAAKTSGTLARPSTFSPSQPQSTAVVAPSKPAFLSHAAPELAPAAMASSHSAFELEKEPIPQPEPAEAALLESMADPAGKIHAEPTSGPKQYPWQQTPRPMAESMHTALKHAAEATGRPDSGISVGHGAAVAPAKDLAYEEEISAPAEKPQRHAPASRVKLGPIAAIILLVAAAGAIYRAGTLTHWHMPSLSLLRQTLAPANPQVAKPATASPSAVTPGPGAPAASALTQSGLDLTTPAAIPQKPSPATEMIVAAPASKKPAVNATSFDPPTPSGVVKTVDEGTTFVDTQTRRPAPPKPAQAENVEPADPGALSSGSTSSDAISGLVNMPSSVPQPGPQTLRISQGISQGLLVKKVAPAYPRRALQTHTQGSVQLLATISKDGDITTVTLLSGAPMLAQAAIDAVKQWKYRPYLLNSQPMEIQTQITVNFKLP
jgi:protein TonB